MSAPKKKKQHYVPRFLLKKFSANSRTLRGISLNDGTPFENAGIAEQCYENYFYGKDCVLEDSFQAEETHISHLLRDLSPECLESINIEDLGKIVFFMHYQKYRTAGAAEYVDNVADAHMKELMKPSLPARLPDGQVITEADLKRARLRTPSPQITSLYLAAGSTPLLLDLEIKFLLRFQPPGFVISDNPVSFYNQFIERNPNLRQCEGITGLAAKGLQMFLPVSPSVCIAVYDPTTYCYGSPTRRTCFVSKRDVLLINQLQALYAYECVYYDEACSDQYRDTVLEIRKHHDVHTPHLSSGPLRQRSDGRFSKVVENWAPDARIGARFSFARMVEEWNYQGYRSKLPPIRSPGLLAYQQDYQRRMESGALLASRAKRSDQPLDAAPEVTETHSENLP